MQDAPNSILEEVHADSPVGQGGTYSGEEFWRAHFAMRVDIDYSDVVLHSHCRGPSCSEIGSSFMQLALEVDERALAVRFSHIFDANGNLGNALLDCVMVNHLTSADSIHASD